MAALELAEKHKFDNIDFIYKEQWRQLGDKVTEASVKNVLVGFFNNAFVILLREDLLAFVSSFILRLR